MASPYASYPPPPPVSTRRRRSLAPWWVALLVLGTGTILGLVWFMLGGLPINNASAYGQVALPGTGTLSLPAGSVYVSFEEDGIFGEDDSAEMPSDLQVLVVGPNGPVVISRLSESLFAINVNNTGRVPYGQIDVPVAGVYQVSASANEVTSAVAPRVTFGEPPWNPFGAPIVGALIIVAPFAVLALILLLPLRRS